ncbi:hypothetical protein PAXRUDRAFT_746436 [Paxillus rubicundulus Ve08.2h10]|uniref:Uncharacterized protein n=1 Tax=Paxillus rubicundulus Ve08.2h10 TaxID=930991 RepID=A0A0D0D100_9AGAM|nr:hypothetical protein PAXRUDRAFT_746436 [Paxillus rubicundulus Ve08.2h10]
MRINHRNERPVAFEVRCTKTRGCNCLGTTAITLCTSLVQRHHHHVHTGPSAGRDAPRTPFQGGRHTK